jgi:hypothetical protein
VCDVIYLIIKNSSRLCITILEQFENRNTNKMKEREKENGNSNCPLYLSQN